MNLEDMKGAVILLGLVALIGAAVAIALDEFQTDLTENSSAWNTSNSGLDGVVNATGFLDTIGTIVGVAVLIGVVILAFRFARA